MHRTEGTFSKTPLDLVTNALGGLSPCARLDLHLTHSLPGRGRVAPRTDDAGYLTLLSA